jgi:hypothetical protein
MCLEMAVVVTILLHDKGGSSRCDSYNLAHPSSKTGLFAQYYLGRAAKLGMLLDLGESEDGWQQ